MYDKGIESNDALERLGTHRRTKAFFVETLSSARGRIPERPAGQSEGHPLVAGWVPFDAGAARRSVFLLLFKKTRRGSGRLVFLFFRNKARPLHSLPPSQTATAARGLAALRSAGRYMPPCGAWGTPPLHSAPRCRGRACPARRFTAAPLSRLICRAGLDPFAGRRGRRPLQA